MPRNRKSTMFCRYSSTIKERLSLSLMKLRYDETTQCFGSLTWLAYDQCRAMLVQIMTTYAGLLESYTYSLVGIDMDFLGFRSRPFSEKVATLGR